VQEGDSRPAGRRSRVAKSRRLAATTNAVRAFLHQSMRNDEKIAAKREAAARARLLARHLQSDLDRDRCLQFAAELEAEADTLEQEQSDRAPNKD